MRRLRRPARPAQAEGDAVVPSRLESFLLSVMGPAQIGDPSAPLTYVPDAASSLCGRCGQPYDRHQRVHSSVTYLSCPES